MTEVIRDGDNRPETVPARMVIRSTLADASLWDLDEPRLRLRGVSRVMEAPIRRTDQGGYGRFGAASEVTRSTRTGG